MLTLDDLKTCAPRMLAVVRLAKQLRDEGTHYLWGAQTDGTPNILIPDRLGPKPEETFMRCATLYAGNTDSGVCAGRPDAPDVKAKPQWDRKDPKASGSAFRWPRYFKDTSTDGSPKVPESLAWGEDCAGRKHFDCAGFVRYCFRQILGSNAIPAAGMRSVAYEVWPSNKAGSPPTIGGVDLWPADILFDDSFTHVGIATGHWLLTGYGVTDANNAIHCYSATVGVIMTSINDARFVNWRHALRWPNWS